MASAFTIKHLRTSRFLFQRFGPPKSHDRRWVSTAVKQSKALVFIRLPCHCPVTPGGVTLRSPKARECYTTSPQSQRVLHCVPPKPEGVTLRSPKARGCYVTISPASRAVYCDHPNPLPLTPQTRGCHIVHCDLPITRGCYSNEYSTPPRLPPPAPLPLRDPIDAAGGRSRQTPGTGRRAGSRVPVHISSSTLGAS